MSSRPPDATVDALGHRIGRVYQCLNANFDIAFTDLTDRDAAFKQLIYGAGGGSWYTGEPFAEVLAISPSCDISAFVENAEKRVAIWQIQFDNTTMRAENITWDHCRTTESNGSSTTRRLFISRLTQSPVVAFLFGRGAEGNTCACDASGEGVTNPLPQW